ncbi:MAG: alpha/beta fold hydrolase [Litoreibacter sp.]|nr:alpha/beta fold hydrolase [Litoreibacter sp.]
MKTPTFRGLKIVAPPTVHCLFASRPPRQLLLQVLFVLVFIFSLGRPVWALDENLVFDQMIDRYSKDMRCGNQRDFPGWERRQVSNPKDGYKIRYSRFGCTLSDRGALVILPGRGDGSYEYFEIAIDFIERGFGPVYVIDHRGQGLSPRLLDNRHKGYVARFEDYVDDAEAFVAAVENDLELLGSGADPVMNLTTNSMGGAIGIGLFQRLGSENPFRSAAFLGAMISVNYHSFTGTPATMLNLQIYSETGALLQAWWRCHVVTFWNPGRCEEYAVESAANGYQSGTRKFSPNTEAIMTNSAARYDLRTHMLDVFDWSTIATEEYDESENWAGPQLGGATNSWVREAARFNREMREPSRLENMVHVPVMLLTGTRDLRSYRPYADYLGRAPDLSNHIDFCERLNIGSIATKGHDICEFVALRGGFHELFMERDSERQQALDTIDRFFRSHSE